MTKYTDGKNIYYASAVLGEGKYAVCKKQIGAVSLGIHKYNHRKNPIVSTIEEAQYNLIALAKIRKWEKYE